MDSDLQTALKYLGGKTLTTIMDTKSRVAVVQINHDECE